MRVKVEGLTKFFGKRKALDNVSFEAADRAFTIILGPPGAGKTTTLKILAGLIKQDSGKIFFDGEDVTNIPPERRNVRMVFQSFALYPHMTVYENIAFPLKVAGMTEEEIRHRVKEVAEFLKIEGLLNRLPHNLSGGEMQRVAIARALAKESDLYLLDEPLVNLDYKLREDMRAELKRMQRELNKTIIYATPDPLEPLAIGDYLIVLNEGKVMQTGRTMDVYQNPENVFVGKYFSVPPMNLMEGTLRRKGERIVFESGEFTLDLTEIKDRMTYIPADVVIGIRPHEIKFSMEKIEGGIRVKTILGEVIGSDTIVHFKLGENLVKVFVPRIYRLFGGEEAWIKIDPKSVYVFDKRNEKSILRRLSRNG